MLPFTQRAAAQPTPDPNPTAQIAYPPGNVSLAAAQNGVTVTWAAPAVDSTHDAATGANLQFSPSGANTWTTVYGVTSPYLLSGLAAGASVDVQLQSTNGAGASAWSNIATLGTLAAAPGVPVSVSLAQGTGTNLTVSWTAPAADGTHNAASSFNLRFSPSGGNTWTTVTGITSPYALSGLAGGAAIDVQVQGANASGTGAWSAISTLTTASAGLNAPNAPASVAVAAPPDGTNSKLTITWAAPAIDGTHGAATGYNLRSSPSGANTWTTVTGVSSPYQLNGLAGATSIDVEVQGTAAAGPGAWSAITTGKTWGATVATGNWSPQPRRYMAQVWRRMAACR
jgi:hypothetical protein